MTDTFIGSYATETTDVAQLVGMKAAGNVINVDTTKFANSLSASGATGDLYYRDSSSNIVKLAAGATGDVMTIASGLPAWGSGMTLISSTTVSSPVSSVVFTNIPSSGFAYFKLVLINFETAVAATSDSMRLHVSTDNGSTFKTAAGDYYVLANSKAHLALFVVSGSTSTYKVGIVDINLFGLGNSNYATTAALLKNSYGISATNITSTAIGGGSGTDDGTRVVKEADNAFRIISNGGSNIAGGTALLYGVSL